MPTSPITLPLASRSGAFVVNIHVWVPSASLPGSSRVMGAPDRMTCWSSAKKASAISRG
ncbi:MAG: hypothetical protein M5R40_28650 [Anaerolineae bacterium]|nr:hypothetical protein [Anaerolineae bacterium]